MAEAIYCSTDTANGPARGTVLGCSFTLSSLPSNAPSGTTMPCVYLDGGNPATVEIISDNPQTTQSAVASALATLQSQEQAAQAAAQTAMANRGTIQQRALTNLSTIENWIAANPNGATLNAAQTLAVAKMLAQLCRLVLADTSSLGQT